MIRGLTAALALWCARRVAATMELNILHLNDHHSHIEDDTFRYDVTDLGLSVTGEVKVRFGGYARLVSLFKETAQSEPNVLKIHAGDAITGTVYYTLYQGQADADVMAHVCFDAFVPGNHEFDDGDQGLAHFIDMLHGHDSICPDLPVIGSNIIPGPTSPLQGKLVNYTIKTVGGERIGLVGVDIRGKTMDSSNPDPGTYLTDEAAAAQAAIDAVRGAGVNKVVLLSHVGYGMDQTLAGSLSGVDVIVGGDSHSLLGDPQGAGVVGSTDGPYPTMGVNHDGDPVCIVQAWEYAHLMGHLKVMFDDDGKVVQCSGHPKFPIQGPGEPFDPALAGAEADSLVRALQARGVFYPVAEDAATKALVAAYSGNVTAMKAQVIGSASEDLCRGRYPGQEAGEYCGPSDTWLRGSVLANMVAKAFMLSEAAADAGIHNAGGVRTDVPHGNITLNDLYTLLPFRDTVVTLQMDGQQIKNVLEDALSHTLDLGGSTGAYPYAAGLRWKVDASRRKYSRVYGIEVNPRLGGAWAPIDFSGAVRYTIATNKYIAGGKDGYMTFGLVPASQKVYTYVNYVRPMVDYVTRLGVVHKLPVEEYSTQSYVSEDGCPHFGYAPGACPDEPGMPTCHDIRSTYKNNGCCGNPSKAITELTGPLAYLHAWDRRLNQEGATRGGRDAAGSVASYMEENFQLKERIKRLERELQEARASRMAS